MLESFTAEEGRSKAGKACQGKPDSGQHISSTDLGLYLCHSCDRWKSALEVMIAIIILFLMSVLTSVASTDKVDKECRRIGLLVIPGLGRQDRLDTVVHNLRLLDSQLRGPNHQWDCVVYVYARFDDIEFWSQKEKLDYISSACTVIENPGQLVTANLYMVQPALLRLSYKYLFILLDDCMLLSSQPLDLDRITNIMALNNLTVASPMVGRTFSVQIDRLTLSLLQQVIGANVGGGQKFRNIMQTEAMPGTAGYVSNFVEIFAWVVTIDAYQALWDLLSPSVNPYGWGYDFWYDNYARSRVKGHKVGFVGTVYMCICWHLSFQQFILASHQMGIVSVVKVKHEQDLSTSGRTDKTNPEEKWRAVMEQEKVYKSHRGVDLKRCRTKLNIQNTSWNGAVTGYLQEPQDAYSPRARERDLYTSVPELLPGRIKKAKKIKPKKGAPFNGG